MIVSKKKYKDDLNKVAQKYEKKLKKTVDEFEQICNEHEKQLDGYEKMLKEYDNLHEIHYDGEYMDRKGDINYSQYLQRKTDLYKEENSEESPFLS